MIDISQLGRLPAGQPVAAADLAEAVAEVPWCWVWVVAQEFDNGAIDDCTWRCSSVLPVGIGPLAYSYLVSGLPLMKAGLIASAPQAVAQGSWVFQI